MEVARSSTVEYAQRTLLSIVRCRNESSGRNLRLHNGSNPLSIRGSLDQSNELFAHFHRIAYRSAVGEQTMATGQASTKPPDANEYGGGVSPKNKTRTP